MIHRFRKMLTKNFRFSSSSSSVESWFLTFHQLIFAGQNTNLIPLNTAEIVWNKRKPLNMCKCLIILVLAMEKDAYCLEKQ